MAREERKAVDRSEGFFKLPNDVFRIQLDAYEFKLYAYLVCRAGARGECWPSIPTMSEQLGMSKTTVQSRLKNLEDRGFISNEELKKSKGVTEWSSSQAERLKWASLRVPQADVMYR